MCRCTNQRDQPTNAASVLWDFDHYLGEQLQGGTLPKAEIQALERARERLRRLIVEANGAELAA